MACASTPSPVNNPIRSLNLSCSSVETPSNIPVSNLVGSDRIQMAGYMVFCTEYINTPYTQGYVRHCMSDRPCRMPLVRILTGSLLVSGFSSHCIVPSTYAVWLEYLSLCVSSETLIDVISSVIYTYFDSNQGWMLTAITVSYALWLLTVGHSVAIIQS